MTENWRPENIVPRARVISDNDYCGDPDGVVQLAHHLLCRSVEIPLIISSAVAPHHPQWSPRCGEDGVEVAREVAKLTGREDSRILPGTSLPMESPDTPANSLAAEAIVAEAMRDDTGLPLFVACGGGLTTIASAWLMEPRIADRLTIVWNGGHSYSMTEADLPDDSRYLETNVSTDMTASQIVFNRSNLKLWQMPQGVFSDVVVSRSEAKARMLPHGPLGRHVYNALGARIDAWSQALQMGETYGLGDLPLVLLTALGGAYDPEPYTSRWITRPRPRLLDNGLYAEQPDAPEIRVFTSIDVRLLLEDFYGKLQEFAEGETS
jgi:hypothetical protein